MKVLVGLDGRPGELFTELPSASPNLPRSLWNEGNILDCDAGLVVRELAIKGDSVSDPAYDEPGESASPSETGVSAFEMSASCLTEAFSVFSFNTLGLVLLGNAGLRRGSGSGDPSRGSSPSPSPCAILCLKGILRDLSFTGISSSSSLLDWVHFPNGISLGAGDGKMRLLLVVKNYH